MVGSVSSFSDPEGSNQASKHHHTGLTDEALAEVSGSQLSFSSIVDEVFGTTATGNGVSESGGRLVTESSRPPSDDSLLRKDQKSRKQSASDLVRLIPSLRRVEGVGSPNKRRKTSEPIQHESPKSRSLSTAVATSTKTIECAFGNLIAEANKGNAYSSVFFNALLHVVKHSSLSIKHAKLTRQMDALNLHYVEKMGLRDVTSAIWFQLPFAQDDSWQHICLQLGRAGDMRWDVKIKDQYFTDLWDLQKGSKITPWGSGVHIANSSDVNSHIRYDSEGVVLSYQSVEADSIKKLVADIQRLSNARMLSLRMRKVLGIKQDQRTEEGSADFDRWRAFKIDAVGLTSLWFRFGSSALARFVVEWEPGRDGCTMHVSPDQFWPHTKFLEDFIDGADVESLLDCIRLTIGPLNALAAASCPARASNAFGVPVLPIDVTVVLRGPYWIRIFYRKRFAVDMRCSVGDQVWLQPATPPKGGASIGGSLPCPQFRPFIMEHALLELNVLESCLTGSQQATNPTGNGGDRVNSSVSSAASRAAMKHILSVASASLLTGSGLPVCRTPGELHAASVCLGDVGGYGGGWVPLVALKRVLRSIFKYLGVLWLFSQLPDLLREILKDNEGVVVSLDSEQPALRFFVRGYSFVVSIHRVQLVLQIHSIRRSHQQQNRSSAASAQEELTESEIQEVCDYFTRRVASEPYNASRVASFITLLTLPIPALKEFLKLIAWNKALTQSQQAGETAPSHKPQIELENHSGTDAAKSNIHYDRLHNTVDFALTVPLDPAHIPQTNTAGGAVWLPYCVSVRFRYTFGDKPGVTFLGMEGSHGGQACWQLVDDWEKCKQRVSQTVEDNGSPAEDSTQGILKLVADSLHTTLQLSLQDLKEG